MSERGREKLCTKWRTRPDKLIRDELKKESQGMEITREISETSRLAMPVWHANELQWSIDQIRRFNG